jgi:DNA-binding GntR family transcriptional regulator
MEVAGVNNSEAGMPSDRVTIERRTLMQQAYAAIRQMIITGELAPGAKVVVRPLSERLRLSPTPIKAALVGLERDGFLTAIPHRGYYVPEVNVQDMREIYELREVLDGIAARNAAALPGAAALVHDTLKPLHEKQKATHLLQNTVGYSDADLEFHRAIWHASGNSRLAQVTDNLVGQVRFGSGSSSRLPGRVASALHEHAWIMEAMAAGDSARAEREARAHVRRSATAFEKAVRAREGLARIGFADTGCSVRLVMSRRTLTFRKFWI